MEDQSQSILEDKVNAMIINSFYWNSMIVYSRDILTNMILLNYILIYVCSKRNIILIDYTVIIMRIEHCISFVPLLTTLLNTYYNYATMLIVNFPEFREKIIMNFDEFTSNRIFLANRWRWSHLANNYLEKWMDGPS